MYLELTLVNIMTFLRDHDFPAADAGKLIEQLDGVAPGDILTYKKNHRRDYWNGILIDIIDHWLKNDLNPSWEKLARALLHCEHNAIAAKNFEGETLGMLDSTYFEINIDVFVICLLKSQGLQLPL